MSEFHKLKMTLTDLDEVIYGMFDIDGLDSFCVDGPLFVEVDLTVKAATAQEAMRAVTAGLDAGGMARISMLVKED